MMGMPFARHSPLITLCIAGVFVLVILSQGYLGAIRDLIKQKVAEA
jgi:hypothetical protein